MGGACSVYGGRSGVYRVLVGKPEGKRPFGRPRRKWGIILRWIFRKRDVVVWTGSKWIRVGTGVGRPRRRWGIILKWIFRKRDVVVWTGSRWIRVGTGGGLL